MQLRNTPARQARKLVHHREQVSIKGRPALKIYLNAELGKGKGNDQVCDSQVISQDELIFSPVSLIRSGPWGRWLRKGGNAMECGIHGPGSLYLVLC